MTARGSTSMVPFVLVITFVLAGAGYLGWRAYAAPVDEEGAGRTAVRASEVLVRAAGGDPSICENMRAVAEPGDADGTVRRCHEIADTAAFGGPGLGVRDLQVTDVDVDRNSGTATVSGTMLAPGQSFLITIAWPLTRDGDRWAIADPPDIDVG